MPPPSPRTDALALAKKHPDTLLACPACDAGVKGRNLGKHLDESHPGFAGTLRWKNAGWWPGELALDGRRLVLRRLFFPRRVAELPCAVAIGSVHVTRADPIDVSAGVLSPATRDERAGLVVQLPAGKPAIVVRCKTGGGVRKHWRGWTGAREKLGWNITLSAGDFASFQHVLGALGALAPPT